MSGRKYVLKPRLSSSRQPCSRRSFLMLLAGATMPMVSPGFKAFGLITIVTVAALALRGAPVLCDHEVPAVTDRRYSSLLFRNLVDCGIVGSVDTECLAFLGARML